jgi:hypothetical protein
MRAIRMIDHQIDVMLWIENSLAFVEDWQDRNTYFSKFNDQFIKTYKEFGKYKYCNRVKRGADPNGIHAEKFSKIITILKTHTDFSTKELLKCPKLLALEINNPSRLQYYLGLLVRDRYIKILGKYPRNIKFLEKAID